jgi:hypothetical protein
MRLQFQKRSVLKLVSRTIPHKRDNETPINFQFVHGFDQEIPRRFAPGMVQLANSAAFHLRNWSFTQKRPNRNSAFWLIHVMKFNYLSSSSSSSKDDTPSEPSGISACNERVIPRTRSSIMKNRIIMEAIRIKITVAVHALDSLSMF